MPLNNLHEFIRLIESSGELSRVLVPTDPLLEIAAITNRICKGENGGKALLFGQPLGSTFPVATNLFGSEKRICLALGITDLDELTLRLRNLLGGIQELDLKLLDRQIAVLPKFSSFAPHIAAREDSKLIWMKNPDLTRFPFLQSWPDDGSAGGGGRYITLPQVFTVDTDGETQNCGVYRVQLRGKQKVAVQWKEGSGAAKHAELYRRAGRDMPVAIVLGGDPATLFSAMFPLPGDLDELTFAGFLRGAPLIVADCQNVNMALPIEAEVIIEGYVKPGETVLEGPFGNHTGFYSPAAPASLMQITSIRYRKNSIIPATVVGPPQMEDCRMAKVWERLLSAFIQKIVPAIADIYFPFETVFHQSGIVYLQDPLPGMVREISSRLWSLPWFSSSRVLLFLAADNGVTRQGSDAVWRAVNLTDFSNDIIHDETSGRIAVDATGSSLLQKAVVISAESEELVTRRWKEYKLP